MHGFSRPCSSKQAMLLRELSKHLARIVSINFLRPSAYGYLVHAMIHLAIDLSRSAPSHEKGQQAHVASSL